MQEIVVELSRNGWDCIPQAVPFSSRDLKKGVKENLQVSAVHLTETVYALISKSSTAYCQVRIEDHQTVHCRNKEELCNVLQKTVDTKRQFAREHEW